MFVKVIDYNTHVGFFWDSVIIASGPHGLNQSAVN